MAATYICDEIFAIEPKTSAGLAAGAPKHNGLDNPDCCLRVRTRGGIALPRDWTLCYDSALQADALQQDSRQGELWLRRSSAVPKLPHGELFRSLSDFGTPDSNARSIHFPNRRPRNYGQAQSVHSVTFHCGEIIKTEFQYVASKNRCAFICGGTRT
jgi:hypothetical protein